MGVVVGFQACGEEGRVKFCMKKGILPNSKLKELPVFLFLIIPIFKIIKLSRNQYNHNQKF